MIFSVVVLILIGISSFTTSFVAGGLYLIAGLLLIPVIYKRVTKLKPDLFLFKNEYGRYALVMLFAFLGYFMASSSEKNAIISDFEKNREAILANIEELKVNHEYNLAEIRIEKFLKVMPNNEELKQIYAQIDDQRKKHREFLADQKRIEEQEKREASKLAEAKRVESERRTAAENAKRINDAKVVAVSYQCNTNMEIRPTILTTLSNQDAMQLTAALNTIRMTPGCSVGSQGPRLTKGEWELIATGNSFVALKSNNPQKHGFRYIYGITTKAAFENP